MKWSLIDRIISYDKGKQIIGEKIFKRDEQLFEDHFPGFPIVPGVLQIEMIAATCGKALRIDYPGIFPVLGSVKQAKFYSHIYPEDVCIIKGVILKKKENYAMAEGEIYVNDRRMCKASIVYGMLADKKNSVKRKDPIIEEWEKIK